MKIRLVQLNPIVGDIEGNTKKILSYYNNAENDGIDVVVFPELSICGYPPMDLLERKDFLESVYRFTEKIISATGKSTIIFGAPTENKSGVGRPICNSAIIAKGGGIVDIIHKTLLPTYDVFDEFRYFEPNKEFKVVEICGVKTGITICEDIWNNENEVIYHKYDISPAEELKNRGCEILFNISASPFTVAKPELRLQMLQNHAKALKLPIVYVNQTGANTEVIFDGDSMCVNPDGIPTSRIEIFKECLADAEFVNGNLTGIQNATIPGREERIFKALVTGLNDYLNKTKIAKTVLVGLSGGIDSALTATIACEALGAKNVYGVTMPSEFSSGGSVEDSLRLADNLGLNMHTISIKSLYDAFLNQLDPFFKDTNFNIAEENIQSRARGVLLMALSNKFGHIVLNTGNKSEMAVGYCTLYGDMAGGLSILSDVYKTDVFALSRWLNDTYYSREIIPENTITKPPSAELRPNQKDSDSLPDYPLLDKILKLYIENQADLPSIVREVGNEEIVKRVVRLVDLNEYKRRQAAPGLRISNKAFGYGRRLPIVQGWTSDI